LRKENIRFIGKPIDISIIRNYLYKELDLDSKNLPKDGMTAVLRQIPIDRLKECRKYMKELMKSEYKNLKIIYLGPRPPYRYAVDEKGDLVDKTDLFRILKSGKDIMRSRISRQYFCLKHQATSFSIYFYPD